MKKRSNQADEALLESYEAVATNGASAKDGLEETEEQVNDNYVSGGNEHTFLRGGKDLGKTDGFRPKI